MRVATADLGEISHSMDVKVRFESGKVESQGDESVGEIIGQARPYEANAYLDREER
jgi:hypothetical protein